MAAAGPVRAILTGGTVLVRAIEGYRTSRPDRMTGRAPWSGWPKMTPGGPTDPAAWVAADYSRWSPRPMAPTLLTPMQ